MCRDLGMPNVCNAPGCRTGYQKRKKKKKKENEECSEPEDGTSCTEGEIPCAEEEIPGTKEASIAVFKFPSHDEEPERRAQWIARVPRDYWKPDATAKIFLCEKHFMPDDIVEESQDTNPRRKKKRKTEKLARKQLKPDAMPCRWPTLPDRLNKIVTPRPTSFASSESRQENLERILEEAERERIAKDTFHSLEELILKEQQLEIPEDVYKLVNEKFIVFYKLDADSDIPRMSYSVKITDDLTVTTHFGDEIIPNSVIPVDNMNMCSSLNSIFAHLESTTKEAPTDSELIDDAIHILKGPQFQTNKKVGFLVEQLHLLLKKPNARRYSPSMLAMCVLIERMSPACYKQLYDDGFLTLPSPRHLRRITSAIDVDSLTLNESAVAYLTARFKKLAAKDRIVSALLDEVYSDQKVQYEGGKFFGAEGGEITKTMLCIMLKSICGKYRDVVAMVPIVKINAEKLYTIWTDVVTKVSKIGFDIAVTMSDGHSSNMKFFNDKLLKKNKNSLYTTLDSGAKNFPIYDNTHLFKNFYNNWSNYETFHCPSFPPVDEELVPVIMPSFAHIKELYMIEKGKHQKLAHKLTEQVLHPKPIEKTNVKLADAAFHESTLHALEYYSTRGYGYFQDTAKFIRVVRDWFNTINVKGTNYGKRKRDKRRNAIHRSTMNEDLSYLSLFSKWLQKWKNSDGKGLSNQTFECAIRSCNAIIELVPYLFEKYPDLDFILLGNICSDFLEGRFGWYHQLCGGNYYNCVLQFLQAEKTIRLRSLVSMGYDMKEINQIFSEASVNKTKEQNAEIKLFVDDLDEFRFTDDSALTDADKSLLFYIAGYIAKSSMSECDECNELISPGKAPISVAVEGMIDAEESVLAAKEEFLAAITRGGLTKPSDYMYIVSVHAATLFAHIFKDDDTRKAFLATENPRTTFIETFKKLIKSSELASPLLEIKCSKGHSHVKYIQRSAFTIFNISGKNYASNLNDELRRAQVKKKMEKRDRERDKIQKLQSQKLKL